MTLTRAYQLLEARWRGRSSFSISLEVWRHDHTDSGALAVKTLEWAIWIETERKHYYGSTLEAAMEAALGCDADLDGVEDQIRGMAG